MLVDSFAKGYPSGCPVPGLSLPPLFFLVQPGKNRQCDDRTEATGRGAKYFSNSLSEAFSFRVTYIITISVIGRVPSYAHGKVGNIEKGVEGTGFRNMRENNRRTM